MENKKMNMKLFGENKVANMVTAVSLVIIAAILTAVAQQTGLLPQILS